MKQIISVVLLGLTLTGCRLMGWYQCESLSGWCKPKKPAAIDFWEIKGEPPPSIEDFRGTRLADGSYSVDDNAYRTAANDYFSRKIKKFEACGLDWHTRDKRPLAETFKQEGLDCLEKQGLYRTSLPESVRW